MKPGNRQCKLKWCQFTQSECFGRWEKGLIFNAFLPAQEGFLFFLYKNVLIETIKPYV